MQKIKKQNVIIFDGVCGLCNSSIALLIKLDKKNLFKYTSLQGEYVKSLEINESIDSLIYYRNDQVFYKSTAILKIVKELGGLWSLLQILYIIPPFIRDFVYDIIAKYRYRIFGKVEQCSVINGAKKELFLA
ncbi:MAG: Thiol-disulfide oxidoreductase [uncultured Sulfurovum sp.]|uniref:Thiol-disulfide oxidoreductase n=1 Tax=uncultured Sulfurovum sp. TaxID=269237 RepID=A0A6S6T8K6_9BACT|nr:MAG: Thiol-disulfide oxidoreductase [uncultured Sulfurovum sp.]